MRWMWLVACVVVVSARAADAPPLEPFGAPGGEPAAPWRVVGLPQQTKPFTRFAVVDLDGKRALKVQSELSYGNLVHPLQWSTTSAHLAWQWRIDEPVKDADLRTKAGDDTALKVCVFFDLPMDKVPFADRQLLRYARSKTTDPVPTATVCYVWDQTLPAGMMLDNAFTRRMRYVVVRSGPQQLHQWVSEKRDVGADFLKLFADEAQSVPAIVGIAVGADSDNTRSKSLGYVSGLELAP
ncbi:MAG TPA: DUF3047 domain-containing protein [Caldimonas sp.]|nr:DUF3047 domain-containing protein [Caldimonas sp.]